MGGEALWRARRRQAALPYFPSRRRLSQEAARVTGRTAFARGSRTILATAPFFLGLFFLSGCDDRYPDNLAYGLRTDTIVDDVPTDADKQPAEFDLPGQYPNTLATLSDKGAKVINPADAKALPADKRRELEKALVKRFGTPASPKVEEVSESTSDLLKLSPSTLKQGSQLFRRHCLHCHGLTGNGQGPTAPWVHPHPRDFRRGIFKFTSTTQPQGDARKPRRQDLLRTLREGIEGTSMPTFGILPDKELEAIVSYVIHLSLRGEVELYTMKE